MKYLNGECEGGVSRVLMLNVINPTNPCILNMVYPREEQGNLRDNSAYRSACYSDVDNAIIKE